MTTTTTAFPPATLSKSFLVNFLKIPDDTDTSESASEKAVDLRELWKPKSAKSANGLNTAVTTSKNSLSAFKKWKKSVVVNYQKHHRSANRNSESTTSPDNSNCSDEENMNLLKFLALNALDLTAPASDILIKSRRHQWFQLSGHPDCFAPAGPGTIWKKRSGSDNSERAVYEALTADPLLRDLVPQYHREVDYRGEKFIEIQDLLHGFEDPSVVDIKMGTRTFLESEVQKTAAREDLYQKMVAVDPTAPTAEEHVRRAVTKLRYMLFREEQSSTKSQGFRIEAMKLRGAPPVKDLQKVKSREEVRVTLALFLAGREDTRQRLLQRLYEIRTRLEQSEYFARHEVIGSSLLMIHDEHNVSAWLIDFAKTYPVPDGRRVDHRSTWVQGNHEEGLLYGLDQLIDVIESIDCSLPCFTSTPPNHLKP